VYKKQKAVEFSLNSKICLVSGDFWDTTIPYGIKPYLRTSDGY